MHRFISAAALFTGLFACALFTSESRATAADAPVDMVAKNFTFTPATVQAKVGSATVLHVTSAEGVHGIAAPDLGIAQTTLTPGKMVEVTFTPKKAGTYPVHCSIVCGAGHEKMMFTVTVAP